MIMMSNKVLLYFIVFLDTKNIWFGEKNQVSISYIEKDILTFKILKKRALEVGSSHPPTYHYKYAKDA